MKPEQWPTVEEILHGALAHGAEEQQTLFVHQACAGDASMLREVASLLEAHRRTQHFLEKPLVDQLPDWLTTLQDAPADEHVGPYRLMQELGRGGMGTVYLAERDDQEYHQQVAIKVLKRGLDTEGLLRRFRSERQILASLSHPNIAKLYDGGTTRDGRPYFVMEAISGTRIDHFCDERRLSVRDRLELVRQVCAAVHYAHQNLIVHRDIKPSNILITDDGVSKLLDFGIAKLLDPASFPGTVEPTHLGIQPMTPRYASPEQRRGERITTASDIYALGMLLHRLLLGHLPDEAPAHETPATPRLDADLEKILAMALRDEPERRYASAEQLADDLERYLKGLPVRAQSDTLAYRAGKFIHRHRLATVAVGAVSALIAAFLVALLVQIDATRRERDRAARERDKAQQVSTLLFDLFKSFDPEVTKGRKITAQELLDQGLVRARGQLEGENEVLASALNTIALAYQHLGLYQQALPVFEESLALRRQRFGNDSLEVADSLKGLGDLLSQSGKLARAETVLREALRIEKRALGEDHPEVATTQGFLTVVLWRLGRLEEAEKLQRGALAVLESHLDPEDPTLAMALENLMMVLMEQGAWQDSVLLGRRVLAIRRRTLGEDHPFVATALQNLALALLRVGELATAEPLLRDALAINRKVYGDVHHHVARAMHDLGMLLANRNQPTEAEDWLRRALTMRRQLAIEGTLTQVAISVSALASVVHDQGRLEEAAALYRESLELGRPQVPPKHPGLSYPLLRLGETLLEMGDAVAAEPPLREAYEIRRHALPATSPLTVQAAVTLSAGLIALDQRTAAEKLLLDTLRELDAKEPAPAGPSRAARHQVLTQLAVLYEGWGQPDVATAWRQRLDAEGKPRD